MTIARITVLSAKEDFKSFLERRMWEMQILIDGEWVAIGLTLFNVPDLYLPPYRYDKKADAEAMLQRLYPKLPPDCKRVVRV